MQGNYFDMASARQVMALAKFLIEKCLVDDTDASIETASRVWLKITSSLLEAEALLVLDFAKCLCTSERCRNLNLDEAAEAALNAWGRAISSAPFDAERSARSALESKPDAMTEIRIKELKAEADLLRIRAEETGDRLAKASLLAQSKIASLRAEQIANRCNSFL